MLAALVSFLIMLIVICLIVAVVLWAVKYLFPAIYEPARYVVGAIALIAILIAVLRLVQGGIPGMP
jgi:hypothetical protein